MASQISLSVQRLKEVCASGVRRSALLWSASLLMAPGESEARGGGGGKRDLWNFSADSTAEEQPLRLASPGWADPLRRLTVGQGSVSTWLVKYFFELNPFI